MVIKYILKHQKTSFRLKVNCLISETSIDKSFGKNKQLFDKVHERYSDPNKKPVKTFRKHFQVSLHH